MIDLHLHLIPGVDDGPDSMVVTRDMLAVMAGMGFQRLVATPHLMQPLTPEYYNAVTSGLEAVRIEAQAHRIRVDLGFEHQLDPGMPKRMARGEPSTLAGTSAILVELPFVNWPNYTEATLFELRTAGYRPILAHPERYLEASRRPELVIAVAEKGAVLQLSSGSFMGAYGKTAQKMARKYLAECLERDLPVIFATDAHSPGQRLASTPSGLEWVKSYVANGPAVVEWATSFNPSVILLDQPAIGFASWRRTALPDQVTAAWGRPAEEAPESRPGRRFALPWRS